MLFRKLGQGVAVFKIARLKPKLAKVFIYTCDGKYSQKDIDRFISKINTTPGLGPGLDCWEWSGTPDRYTYGVLTIAGKTMKSHRVAYEMFKGVQIQNNLSVCHNCDNPPCLNPNHLWLGTQIDNNKDRDSKGRCSKVPRCTGEEHGMAKLNWNKVTEIRAKWTTGSYLQRQLAEEYGVGDVNISEIVRNETWYDSNYILPGFKNHTTSKLSYDKEDKIRELYSSGQYSQRLLADMFLVSPGTINRIVNNTVKEVGVERFFA
jgi:hypothetical protein